MQVPTLRLLAMSLTPPWERADWDEALSRLPSAAAAPWLEVTQERRTSPPEDVDTTYGEWGLFMTGRAHAAGVPIGAGTDTPIGFAVPGYSLHSELEFLVRAGLSPLEALKSATVRPAEYFSLEDEMGTIDVGKRADLVLLDANPLTDITNTRAVFIVVTKGLALTQQDLQALLTINRD
jgi:imidazolonepropionase-like amidohydrolase